MISEKIRPFRLLPQGMSQIVNATPWEWMRDPRDEAKGFDFAKWRAFCAALPPRQPLVIDFELPVKQVGKGDYSEQLRDLLAVAREANPGLRIGPYGTPADEFWASAKFAHHKKNLDRVNLYNNERDRAGILALCDFLVPDAWIPDGADTSPDFRTLVLDMMERQAKRGDTLKKPAIIVTGCRTSPKATLMTCEHWQATLDLIAQAYAPFPNALEGVAFFDVNKEGGQPDDWIVIEPYVRDAIAWVEAVNAPKAK